MLTDFLFSFLPIDFQKSIFTSLSAEAEYIIFIIRWIVDIGFILFLIQFSWRGYTIAAIRWIHSRISKMNSTSSGTEDTIARLRKICWHVPVLKNAIRMIERLDRHSARRLVDDVVELSLARYKPVGLLQLFQRMCILLGLIGTLIGLTMAIQNVYFDIESLTSIENLREPLRNTLSGLGTAFTTTLFGVIGAVVLSPLLIASRWMNNHLLKQVDTILTTSIVPLAAPDNDDLLQSIREMVETVSRQVVEKTFTETVESTSNAINQLCVQLVSAVQTAADRQINIQEVIDRLEHAAGYFSDAAEKTNHVLGFMRERINQLNDTIAKITPESELRLEVVKTIGKVLEQELAKHWSQITEFNSKELEQIQQIVPALNRLQSSIDQASSDMDVNLSQIQNEGISNLSDLKTTIRDVQIRLDDMKAWMADQSDRFTAEFRPPAALLAHTVESIREHVDSLQKGLEEQAAHFPLKNLNNKLSVFPNVIVNPLIEIKTEMIAIHKKMDKAAKILERINRDSTSIESWNLLKDSVDEMNVNQTNLANIPNAPSNELSTSISESTRTKQSSETNQEQDSLHAELRKTTQALLLLTQSIREKNIRWGQRISNLFTFLKPKR